MERYPSRVGAGSTPSARNSPERGTGGRGRRGVGLPLWTRRERSHGRSMGSSFARRGAVRAARQVASSSERRSPSIAPPDGHVCRGLGRRERGRVRPGGEGSASVLLSRLRSHPASRLWGSGGRSLSQLPPIPTSPTGPARTAALTPPHPHQSELRPRRLQLPPVAPACEPSLRCAARQPQIHASPVSRPLSCLAAWRGHKTDTSETTHATSSRRISGVKIRSICRRNCVASDRA
jgi:hypothetical protein